MSEVTKEDIADLEREADACKRAYDEAYSGLSDARRRLATAKHEYAIANPHPWTGKLVERQVSYGYRGKTATRTGTVEVFDKKRHPKPQNAPWRGLEAGAMVVVSKTGKTCWPLELGERVGRLETRWELVDE